MLSRLKSSIAKRREDAQMAKSLSYSSDGDPLLSRLLVRNMERATGKYRLLKAAKGYQDDLNSHENIWSLIIDRLGVTVDYSLKELSNIPETGPAVIVCNHPYGLLDGAILAWLISQRRKDFKILTHALFTRIEEAQDYLLPVNFDETPEALRENIAMRKKAIAHLNDGGLVAIFPCGSVSTAKPSRSLAADSEWKTFTAKMIEKAEAPTIPLFFEGQNSRLFHMASNRSALLRQSLLIHELRNKIGKRVSVRIGDAIAPETLSDLPGRHEVMTYLRDATYALGGHRNVRVHEFPAPKGKQ